MNDEENTKVTKGLTLKAFVVGIIGALVVNFFTSMNYMIQEWHWQGNAPPFTGGMRYVFPSVRYFYTAFAFAFLFLFIIAIINKARCFFSKQEASIIAVMTLISTPVSGVIWFLVMNAPVWSLDPDSTSYYLNCTTPVLHADMNYIKYLLETPMATPNISMFVLNLLWSALFVTFFFYSIYFLLLLFRRTWLDIEVLQFPLGDLASEMVDLTQPSSSVKMFKSKYFWIGFAVQFIWLLIEVAPNVILHWADTSPYTVFRMGFPEDIPGTGLRVMPRWDLGVYGIITSMIVVSLEPWRIGWCSMLSMDVLVGFFIAWLVFYIIYPFILNLTVWGPASPGASYGNWASVAGYWVSGPSPLPHVFAVGLMFSILALSIIRNRSILWATFKGIIKEPAEDIDPNRPFPYRWIWLGFTASFLITIGLASALNVDMQVFVIWFILWLLFTLAFARIAAETGGNLGSAGMNGYCTGWWRYLESFMYGYGGLSSIWDMEDSLTKSTTLFLTTMGAGGGFISREFDTYTYLSSYGISSWKIGKREGNSMRDIVIAIMVTTFIAALAQGSFQYMWLHIMPYNEWLSNPPVNGLPNWCITRGGSPNVFWNIGTWICFQEYPMEYLIKLIAGLAVPFILVFLRKRWAWLRISVAGLAFGAWFGPDFWSAVIAAMIIKYIVLKIGGTSLHQEKLVPIATGFICGMLMVYLIFGAIITPLWNLQREPTPF